MQQGPDCLGAAHALGQLVADIAGFQAGKDQYIGAAFHLGVLDLLPGDLGNDGGIELHVAIDGQCRALRLHQARGFHHFVDRGMPGAAAGGERQHGYARRIHQQVLRAVGRGHRDLGQLKGVGVHHQPAIGKNQAALQGMERLAQHHQEEARYQLERRVNADDLDGGAHHVGGGVHGAGHRAVRVAQAHHQVGEAQGLEHFAPGVFQRHAFFGAQGEQLLREGRCERGGGGVDQVHAGKVDGLAGGRLADARGITHQHDARYALAGRALRGLQDARVFAFAQHDAPGLRAGALDDAVDRFHDGVRSE